MNSLWELCCLLLPFYESHCLLFFVFCGLRSLNSIFHCYQGGPFFFHIVAVDHLRCPGTVELILFGGQGWVGYAAGRSERQLRREAGSLEPRGVEFNR